MKAQVRICMVGAGRVGKVHSRSITRHVPGGKVVALVDPAQEVLEATATEFGIQACYATLEEALDKTASWHMSSRLPDGGWTYRPGTTTGATGGKSSRNMTMAATSSMGVTRLLFYGPQKKDKDKESESKENENSFE